MVWEQVGLGRRAEPLLGGGQRQEEAAGRCAKLNGKRLALGKLSSETFLLCPGISVSSAVEWGPLRLVQFQPSGLDNS